MCVFALKRPFTLNELSSKAVDTNRASLVLSCLFFTLNTQCILGKTEQNNNIKISDHRKNKWTIICINISDDWEPSQI